MPVMIAETGGRFEPGTCYIGELDGHLALATKGLAQLVHDGTPRQRQNASYLERNGLAGNDFGRHLLPRDTAGWMS
jgi:hypothetical protein